MQRYTKAILADLGNAGQRLHLGCVCLCDKLAVSPQLLFSGFPQSFGPSLMGAGVTSSLFRFPHDSVVDRVRAKYTCSSMRGRWGLGR